MDLWAICLIAVCAVALVFFIVKKLIKLAIVAAIIAAAIPIISHFL